MVFFILCYFCANLPDSFYRDKNVSKEFSVNAALKVTADDHGAVNAGFSLNAAFPGASHSTLKFMGLIPVKNVEVHDIDVPELVPCGTPFGIKIMMDGVMVISTGEIQSGAGTTSPAGMAGIQKGDIIKSINSINVYSNDDISRILSGCSQNETVEIDLCRDGRTIRVHAVPVYSSIDKKYELGLWVRDSSAGIGTVTYYNTSNGTFGGLGHPVCDCDTGEILPLSSGEVADVEIRTVKKGKAGYPGELQGYFTDSSPCGELYINNKFGVFGKMDNPCPGAKTIPMGLKQEIKKGKACIYSTLCGDSPESYEIEITEINYANTDTSKNMIIKITDPELLSKAGGIVQGMSGSPIIQNGKLIGAVTHVFVNDPTMGYAVFCENMYEMSFVN
ncbi:MAG: SpoIVB peptidase [Oscillospiraceae bacterium]|nr:SpoIVB peptidase [Oscillospiraceae bacterium]